MHTHFSERPSHVRTFEMIETGNLRERLERAIEDMIATLDALDGDSDFEPASDDEDGGDCEASLGGADDDCEADEAEMASW